MTSSDTTALLFPGQGSHAVGMEEPYADHPLLVRGIELLGFDPFERLADGPGPHQPAPPLAAPRPRGGPRPPPPRARARAPPRPASTRRSPPRARSTSTTPSGSS